MNTINHDDGEEGIVFVAKGDLPSQDREALRRVLARLGLQAVSYTPEAWDAYLLQLVTQRANEIKAPQIVPLETITSRESFLGKEHFKMFQTEHAPDIDTKTAGRAFNTCIDARPSGDVTHETNARGIYVRSGIQPNAALIVELRTDAGLPPFQGKNTGSTDGILPSYAIQTGSFIDYGISLATSPKPNKSERFIVEMAQHLALQVIDQ